jgi:hypothetical protein
MFIEKLIFSIPTTSLTNGTGDVAASGTMITKTNTQSDSILPFLTKVTKTNFSDKNTVNIFLVSA